MRFETIAVHAGAEPDPATGAIASPIHLSTTFEHGPAGQTPHGYMYIRESNPTQTRLEHALAIERMLLHEIAGRADVGGAHAHPFVERILAGA